MVRTARDLVLALVLAALAVGRGHGQSTPAPGPGVARFGLPVVVPDNVPGCPAFASPCTPYEDNNGPLLIGDPRLDGPGGAANLGWTGSIEANIVQPNIQSRLFSNVVLGATVNNRIPDPAVDAGKVVPIALPVAHFPWTVMPRFELGYRFGQGAGEVLTAYRFLIFSGTSGPVHSSGSLNLIDLDYASHESSLGPLWDMKWRAGVRIANIFSESAVSSALGTQRATDAYTGAGPHWALDLRRKLQVNGLSLFGRIDNSYPIGQLTQLYEDTVAGVGGTTRLRSPTPLVSLGVQAGLSYCPRDNLSMTAGYTYEHFWDLITFFGAASRGESLALQGFFVRAEWKY